MVRVSLGRGSDDTAAEFLTPILTIRPDPGHIQTHRLGLGEHFGVLPTLLTTEPHVFRSQTQPHIIALPLPGTQAGMSPAGHELGGHIEAMQATLHLQPVLVHTPMELVIAHSCEHAAPMQHLQVEKSHTSPKPLQPRQHAEAPVDVIAVVAVELDDFDELVAVLDPVLIDVEPDAVVVPVAPPVPPSMQLFLLPGAHTVTSWTHAWFWHVYPASQFTRRTARRAGLGARTLRAP
jgi:hypothetical protein